MLTVSTQNDYLIVYNLTEQAPELYLPNAFVVSQDQQGLPAHIRQRALPDTIGTYEIKADPATQRLFELMDLLDPSTIEKKFSPRRKRQSLAQLWKDREIRKLISPYVDRNLSEWLDLIVKHDRSLSLDVERKVLVSDLLLNFPSQQLEPHLHFEKTPEGTVKYRLLLREGDESWKISEKEVQPLTNEPAWLLVNDQLYRLENLNGHLVKPFRQKDEVNIPKDKVKTYFEKFILKVAEKSDVDAQGFDIEQHDTLKAVQVRVVRDFLQNQWYLTLDMIYDYHTFEWSETRNQRSRLLFNNGEDIRILQINRDRETESIWIERLGALGLHQTGNYFSLSPNEKTPEWSLLEWLAVHRQNLEEKGFEVVPPQWEDRAIALEKPELQLGLDRENDWFDLKGMVRVGNHQIPFPKMAKYIQEGNRFYPLPEGTYFLIPEEWFTKYREVLSFARKEKDQLRLHKNKYMLLQDLGYAVEAQTDPIAPIPFTPSSRLKAELRPYQLEGAQWLVNLYHNGLGACLADDMGLGKTLQTLAVLLYAKEEKTRQQEEQPAQTEQQLGLFDQASDLDRINPLGALVVLPASLVFNWQQEIRKFAPHLSVYAHVGIRRQKDLRVLQRWDIILSTYQTVLRDVELLKQLTYEYIVLDESQQIKNRNSKVFKAISQLEGKHKISLSGTPIENSLSDLWSQMQFINPDLLGSFSFFKRQFITPIEKGGDESRKVQLKKLVNPYLLRRTKEEVASDLPELTTQVFWCEMTTEQKKLYEKEKSAARNYLLDHFKADDFQYRAIVVKTLTRLRQLVNHPILAKPEYQKESGKFTSVLDHWEQVRRSGHKALFFSSMVKYLDLFKGSFEEQGQSYAWLSGQTTSSDREKQVRSFQENPELQSFLISIKAGGTGLNLTAADYVFILDPWWNPFIEKQAIARAHRIGQERNVIALKFITRETIEEKILRLQDRKTQLAEDILETGQKTTFSREELEFLLT